MVICVEKSKETLVPFAIQAQTASWNPIMGLISLAGPNGSKMSSVGWGPPTQSGLVRIVTQQSNFRNLSPHIGRIVVCARVIPLFSAMVALHLHSASHVSSTVRHALPRHPWTPVRLSFYSLKSPRSSLPSPVERAEYHRELVAAIDTVERACHLCVDVRSSRVALSWYECLLGLERLALNLCSAGCAPPIVKIEGCLNQLNRRVLNSEHLFLVMLLQCFHCGFNKGQCGCHCRKLSWELFRLMSQWAWEWLEVLYERNSLYISFCRPGQKIFAFEWWKHPGEEWPDPSYCCWLWGPSSCQFG